MWIERGTESLQGDEFRDTFQKNSYCPLCSTFSNPHYKADWLVLSTLGNVSISKLMHHKLKLQLNLRKTKYFTSMPMLLYHHNSKFKIIIPILCLIHAWFVLRSSQHYSWVVFPPSMESVHWFAGRNMNSARF